MRNKVLERISEKFLKDESLYLLLGDLGVFQAREAMKIDKYRCINYGIMEQSMISFAAGISIANCYPIIYSITPFIVERCFEQLKLDFGYNKSRGLIITAGGSFDYNKLGPSHYAPNDISLITKTECKNILLPWNEKDAVKFIDNTIDEKLYTYLRISSEEINESIKPKDLRYLDDIPLKEVFLGIGPDSYLIANSLNYNLDFSISIIDEATVDNIIRITSKGINLTIIAGFNLDFLFNLLNRRERPNFKNTHNSTINLIYSMNTKFDTSETKISHLTSNIFSNKFILK